MKYKFLNNMNFQSGIFKWDTHFNMQLFLYFETFRIMKYLLLGFYFFFTCCDSITSVVNTLWVLMGSNLKFTCKLWGQYTEKGKEYIKRNIYNLQYCYY